MPHYVQHLLIRFINYSYLVIIVTVYLSSSSKSIYSLKTLHEYYSVRVYTIFTKLIYTIQNNKKYARNKKLHIR